MVVRKEEESKFLGDLSRLIYPIRGRSPSQSPGTALHMYHTPDQAAKRKPPDTCKTNVHASNQVAARLDKCLCQPLYNHRIASLVCGILHEAF
jgi:hypothetical protein